AILAAANQTGQNVDYVEMILNDEDQYKGTVAGILDLPGQAHANNFQAVPGKSKFFAKIDVRPKKRVTLTKKFDVTTATNSTGRVESGHWPLIAKRSSHITDTSAVSAKFSPDLLKEITSKPKGPSEEEKQAWATQTKNNFDALVANSKALGKPIDE